MFICCLSASDLLLRNTEDDNVARPAICGRKHASSCLVLVTPLVIGKGHATSKLATYYWTVVQRN